MLIQFTTEVVRFIRSRGPSKGRGMRRAAKLRDAAERQ